MNVKIEPSWAKELGEEFEKPYFTELTEFVKGEYASGKTIYPSPKDIFRAFDACAFADARFVILGQDPYHGAHQANGLAFAVQEQQIVPPSLKNMFKEIQSDLGIEPDVKNGDLSRWAKQGVLLLNATLTVEANTPGSHQGRGWEFFADAVIKALSGKRQNLVFLLWGNYARAKGAHIDRSKHLVLESPHPSPFSAHSGFFGSKHFSQANTYLLQQNHAPIDWK